jgi:hypothetical protein
VSRGPLSDLWCTVLWRHFGDGGSAAKTINKYGGKTGGEAGIRIVRVNLSKWLMARDFWS